MTVSFLRCLKKWPDLLLRQQGRCVQVCAALLLVLGVLFYSNPALAEADIEFRYAELVPSDDQYVVNAALKMAPNARVEELVKAGVSVPFVLEFVITRRRWYWFDATMVERLLEFKLSYHALTGQYRLSVGSIFRNFDTYQEALGAMLTVHNWAVTERSRLKSDSYQAAIRFRLNTSLLPKPFQVAALGSRDLDLNTNWMQWSFLATPR